MSESNNFEFVTVKSEISIKQEDTNNDITIKEEPYDSIKDEFHIKHEPDVIINEEIEKECNNIDDTYLKLEDFTKNTDTCVPENPYQEDTFNCTKCEYKTNFKHNLTIHVDRKHNTDGEMNFCKHCPYKSTSVYKLKEHNRSRHQNVTYSCTKCYFKTISKKYFDSHMIRKHNETKGTYSCKECNYSNPFQRNLLKHMRQAHVAQHKCIICNYTTGVKGNLTQHIERKHNKKETTYFCEQCPHSTFSKYRMKHHVKIQHQGKIHECSDCSYTTPFKSNLTVHIEKNHSIEAINYSCGDCDFNTTTKANLKLHIARIHQEISFDCTKCDFKTGCKRNLDQHIERKHNEDKVTYLCESCDYRSWSLSNLRQHTRRRHILNGKTLKKSP